MKEAAILEKLDRDEEAALNILEVTHSAERRQELSAAIIKINEARHEILKKLEENGNNN